MKNLKSKIRAVNVLGALMVLMSLAILSCNPTEDGIGGGGGSSDPLVGSWQLIEVGGYNKTTKEMKPLEPIIDCWLRDSQFLFNSNGTCVDKSTYYYSCNKVDVVSGRWEKVSGSTTGYKLNVVYRYPDGNLYDKKMDWDVIFNQAKDSITTFQTDNGNFRHYQKYIRIK
ncbi:MAG: hypothetical protein C4K58_00310 [Flavobacteriaceae bacterium]|nr:MAG: hypothetical protein C4K58_00310 [Flavobacteriaceae bacterium]